MDERSRRMRTDSYIKEAVVQLFALKIRTGSSKEELKSFSNRCLLESAWKAQKSPKSLGLDIHRLGSVLRAWHTDEKYLADDGSPRPLPRYGRNSLNSLIHNYYPASKYELVFERLKAASLIKRHSQIRWLPTGKHARISQLSLETLEHLAEGVARYVETVTKNVTSATEEDVLFERSCKVTRLPPKEFGAFREYVGQQAIAFITAIDDWLESRNLPATRRRKGLRTAGVYTFAYMDRK
jgi:hypothetical protein